MRSLKVLTYNIFLRPPPIKTNEDDHKDGRFVDFIKRMGEYDVICLQEMFQTGSFRMEELISQGIEKGFHFWCMSECPSFGPGPVVDSGLVVLSKYTIDSSVFESYRLGVLSDSASDKGYIYARIVVHGQVLHLFNTHLQASYGTTGTHLLDQSHLYSQTVRKHQITILAERVATLLKRHNHRPHELVLLVGDLNINAREESAPANKELKSQRGLSTAGESQYYRFIEIMQAKLMKVRDFAFEAHNQHPVTFGDGETVLTGPSEAYSKQRLDYLLELKSLNGSPSKLRPVTNTCKIQHFFIQNKPYKQLSDHYGLSINICLQQ